MIDFYDDLQIKKIMFILILLSCVFSSLSLVIALLKPGNLFTKPSFVQEKMIPLDVCYYGFDSLVKKKVIKDLFSDKAYEMIKSSNFDPFELKEIKEVGQARPIEKDHDFQCQITVKDEIGLRSFLITLEETNKKAFGHVIKGIEERELKLTDNDSFSTQTKED